MKKTNKTILRLRGAGVAMARVLLVWLLVATQTGVLATLASAQSRPGDPEYRFKVGDRLYLGVPDRSALNRELKIDDNGAISLPLAGDVQVVGLTAAEARTKIYTALHEIYPTLTEDDVSVEAVVAWAVYVTGAVSNPGRYTFPNPPNLWQAIREAGGATANAMLGQVSIVEDESRGGSTRSVDVQAALDQGSVDQLPMLNEGDTVIIPSQAESYTGSFGVSVYGAVQAPGVYRLQGRQDLATAVLLAGGPSPRASLDGVTIVRPVGDGTFETIRVDLKKHLEKGDPTSNPQLKPGDTVNVPEQNPIAYQFRNNLSVITGVVASVVSLTLLYIRLK